MKATINRRLQRLEAQGAPEAHPAALVDVDQVRARIVAAVARAEPEEVPPDQLAARLAQLRRQLQEKANEGH